MSADPSQALLQRAQLAGRALAQSLMASLNTERGIHIETLLSALGSLAGYSVQASLRESDETLFVTATGADGRKYFYGDALNKQLAEDRYSIWSLTYGVAGHLGCAQPIDVVEIFKYVASTVGGPQFGIPRIAEDHRPSDIPANWIKYAWPKTLATIRPHCASPAEWPIALALAIQDVMLQAKGAIDPCLALSIVMECAIPMSKIDASTL